MTVEKNGTPTSHHSPVTTKAITTITHALHQFRQKSHDASLPKKELPCTCTHSVTPHFFSSITTQLVKHPVSTAAISIFAKTLISSRPYAV